MRHCPVKPPALPPVASFWGRWQSSRGHRLKTVYWLPCSCGKPIAVEPRQAGQSVTCVCGKAATVPNLLQLAQLERCPDIQEVDREQAGAETSVTAWGLSQRLWLAGAVFLVLVVAGAIYGLCTPPISPAATLTPEAIRQFHQYVQQEPMARTLERWHDLRQTGLERGLTKQDDAYQQALARYFLWWGVLAVFGLLGGGLVAAGIHTRPAKG